MGVRKGQVSVGVGGLLGYAKRRSRGTTSKGERFFAPTWLGPRSPAGPFGSFDLPLRRALDGLWTNGGREGPPPGPDGGNERLGRMVEIPAGAGMTGWARERWGAWSDKKSGCVRRDF